MRIRTKIRTCRECSTWQSRIHVDPARNPRAHSSVCTRAPVWNCRLASTSRCFMYHPTRRPRRMAFQRSRSRVAQLDPLAWIIESRSITTPSIDRKTDSVRFDYAFRPRFFDRPTPHSSTDIFIGHDSPPAQFPSIVDSPTFCYVNAHAKDFPSGVSLSGWIVFWKLGSWFRLYSIGCMEKYFVRNTFFFFFHSILLRFRIFYPFRIKKRGSKIGSHALTFIWIITQIDFWSWLYCVTKF